MDLNFWKKDNVSEDSLGVEDSTMEYQYSSDVDTSPEVVNSPEYYKPDPADPEKAKFYNNISKWAVYIGVFLTPLFFLPWTTNVLELNKQLLLLFVASVGLVSWLLGVVSSGYLAWRPNPLDKGILAFLGVSIVGSVFSVNRVISIFGTNSNLSNALISIISLTILYFLVVNNSEDGGKKVKSLLELSLIVSFLYGLLQMFGVHIFSWSFATSKSFNTVGSINTLGMLAAVALPLFSKSKIELKGLSGLHLEKIGVVLSLVFLVLLNWWVLWVVAIAGMVAMIIMENLAGARFKMNKLLLPMTVVVLGVFMLVINLNLNALKKDLPVEVGPSYTLSKDVTVSVFKEKPVFGYGLENFSVAFDKFGAGRLANSSLSDVRFFDGTSEVFTLVVDGGAVMAAGLLFLLFCLVMVFWNFQRYALENSDLNSVKENIGVLASSVAILTAMFVYPFSITMMMVLYLMMGLSVLIIFGNSRREFNVEERTSLSLGSSLGFIGGLILVLVGVYFGVTSYVSDVKYAQALAATDNSVSAGLLVEAINWNNQEDRYYRTASQKALQLLSNELNQKASPERDARIQNYVATSISLAKNATQINPSEALNWANLGFVYQNLLPLVDGVDKLSEDAYTKAAELRPGDPVFAYRIALLYLAKFDLLTQLVNARRITVAQANPIAQDAITKAEDNLNKAIEQAPNFGLAIYNLGVIYDRENKVSEAIKQLEKIAPANSNQPGLAFELGLLYYRAGKKDDAFNALQRAVVLAPDYANARWYLALILEERGDLDGAIAQLESILSVDVNKDNEVVAKKLEDLRAGKLAKPPVDILDQQPIQ